MTTCKNTKVSELLRNGFDANGYIVAKGSRARCNAAKAILADDETVKSIYGTVVDGFDAVSSLTILANPNVKI